MDDQIRRLRELLESRYGLGTSVELLKGGKCIIKMLAPRTWIGDDQTVAAFHLYFLPQERRFYLQDKRYAPYLELKRFMIEATRDVAEECKIEV